MFKLKDFLFGSNVLYYSVSGLNPERYFTGREDVKRIFLDKLVTPQELDDWRMLSFYGVGGEGKSALCKYLRDGSKDQSQLRFSEWAAQTLEQSLPDYKIGFVDFNDVKYQQVYEALMQIRTGFSGCGIDFFNFDLAFISYFKKAHPNEVIESKFKIFSAGGELLSDLASLAGTGTELIEPLAGTAFGLLLVFSKYAKKLKPKYRQWYKDEGFKLAYELDVLDEYEILKNLPTYLGKDLQQALSMPDTSRLVIMMDTYEALQGKSVSSMTTGSGLHDEWVRSLVSASSGVLFVLFGRDSLKWEDYSKSRKRRDYVAMLEGNQHELGILTDGEAHLFLEKAGIYDAKYLPVRDAIVKASKGHPFYLDLQLDSFLEEPSTDPKEFSGTEKDIINRFRKHLSDYEQFALDNLSQVRYIDVDIFEYLKEKFFAGSPITFTNFVRHSFIRETEQPNRFTMHQLMQEHLSEALQSETPPNRFQNIHESLFEYFDAVAIVEDIKDICLEQEDALLEADYHKTRVDSEDYFEWVFSRATPFKDAARYRFLIPFIESSLESIKNIRGEEHPDYATGLNNLALLFESMGRYEEAEPLYREAIEIGKKTVGEEHPSYAKRLNNLAVLLMRMGCYEEAELLYREAIEIDKKTVGEEHPEYATRLNNLALLFESMGRYEEAEPLYREAIEIDKKTVGEEHPEYATGLNNLANLLHSMGRYEEAEPLYREAIEIDKKTVGEEHPIYAIRFNNLAGLLHSMGRYEEAEPLSRKAIEIGKKTVGEEHPAYAKGLNNLANLLKSIGRYEEAEPLYREAIEIDKKTVGEEHPEYATRLNNLAGLLESMGRYEQVEPLYLQAIEILENKLGEEHPNTITGKRNYQDFLEAQKS